MHSHTNGNTVRATYYYLPIILLYIGLPQKVIYRDGVDSEGRVSFESDDGVIVPVIEFSPNEMQLQGV